MLAALPLQVAVWGELAKRARRKSRADKRFPRDNQPADYFKKVAAPFKPKDKTVIKGSGL